MNVSIVVTLLNEEKTIAALIRSIAQQTQLPHEVIFVDGGSQDNSLKIIKRFSSLLRRRKINVVTLNAMGNRSVGRNAGVRVATSKIIGFTDAGCILDKNWLKNIAKPFAKKKIGVVAGYYKGRPRTLFQKCLIPYVLVMPDKVISATFLPATRSMAIRKSIFEDIKGFDEKLSHNEDYAFAQKLRKAKFSIYFEKNAIAYWIPRKTFSGAFYMFYRFARGDAQAGIIRGNVLLLFGRYMLGLYLFSYLAITKSKELLVFLLLLVISYIAWAIVKNYKYVGDKKAVFILLRLQITADFSVMFGTIRGLIDKLSIKSLIFLLKNNKIISLIISFYIVLVLFQLNWGIPNPSHPFPYFMDEWHSLEAVRSVFKLGTPNIAGAAHGFVFYFYQTGIYLLPFMILGIVNPFAIKSSVGNLAMQEKLFQLLRINTLLFGIGSLILVAVITKKYIKKEMSWIGVALFSFSPIWLMLSNYYKYDIAVVFFMLLSVLFMYRFAKEQSRKNFILLGVVSGFALAAKISTVPFFAIYPFSYFWFTRKQNWNVKDILLGIIAFLLIFFFFAIPDVLLGKANYKEFLYSNFVSIPQVANTINFGKPSLSFLLANEYFSMFGHLLYLFFVATFIFWTIKIIFSFFQRKLYSIREESFLYASLIAFVISLVPLGWAAGGNRSLVLYPYLILLTFCALKRISITKTIVSVLLIIVLTFQILESLSWLSLKLFPDPRSLSSDWISQNIPRNSTIGLENIPIYQMIPDVILRDFYDQQYKSGGQKQYNYKIVVSNSRLPEYVIVTNGDIATNYYSSSPTKMLVSALNKNDYNKVVSFGPNLYFYGYVQDKLAFSLEDLVPVPSITIYKK